MTTYFKQYVPKYADIVESVAKLLRNKEVFRWKRGQEAAFRELKGMFLKPPILVCPDFDLPFFIVAVASGTGFITAALLQEYEIYELQQHYYRNMNETSDR